MPSKYLRTPEQKKREKLKKSQYLGNPNLKRANIPLEYTQWQMAEYKKCAESVDYFCNNYMKITTLDQGEQFYHPYSYQSKIIESSIKNRFTICKMPRQSGKTTSVVAVILWFVLFTDLFSVAILANKAESSRKILKRLQFAYEKLPFWLQQGVIEWNKSHIELENGAQVLASSTTGDAVRGDTFNMVYLDEFAFVENHIQDDFFASVYPTISSGKSTRVLITSTPNGLNMFYKMWTDAIHKNNDYNPIDIHWSDTPGRDEKWKSDQLRNMPEEKFRIEFGCEFIGSQNTLISPDKLRQIPFILPKYFHGDHTKIYKEAVPGHIYVIVVDSSQGIGSDYSAFPVIDVTEVPYEIVAVYRNNKIASILFPNVVFNAAKNYNHAYVLIEINEIGHQVATLLHDDLEYENMLMTEWQGRGGQTLGNGFGKRERRHLGVRTTMPVKRVGCATLKTIVESDKIIINDFDVLSELSTFIIKTKRKNQAHEADVGCFDDLVMCLVLFSWMSIQPYFRELTNIDIRKNLNDANMDALIDQSTPFMFEDDGVNNIFDPEPTHEFSKEARLHISYPLDMDDDYGNSSTWDSF